MVLMDWVTFFSNLIDSVALPGAIVGIVFIFKAAIERLIDRIKSITHGGTNVGFDQNKKENAPITSDTVDSEPGAQEATPSLFASGLPPSGGDIEIIREKYPTLPDEADRIRSIVEQGRSQNEEPEVIEGALIGQLAASNFRAWAEREYSTIFGSQILLLRKMNETPDVGLTKDQVKEHFENAFHTYPDFYKGINVESYLAFLFQSGVVKIKNEAYRVTKLGN